MALWNFVCQTLPNSRSWKLQLKLFGHGVWPLQGEVQKDLTDKGRVRAPLQQGPGGRSNRHRRPHVLKHIKTMSNIVKPWTPGTETCIFSIFFCCVAGSFQIHHVLLSRVLYELVFGRWNSPRGRGNSNLARWLEHPFSCALWCCGHLEALDWVSGLLGCYWTRRSGRYV